MESQARSRKVVPFIKKLSTMTDEDYGVYDLALKNGDKNKIDQLNIKYDLSNEYQKVQETLNEIYNEFEKVGYDVKYKKKLYAS